MILPTHVGVLGCTPALGERKETGARKEPLDGLTAGIFNCILAAGIVNPKSIIEYRQQ